MYLLAFNWLKINADCSGLSCTSQCFVGLKLLAMLLQATTWPTPTKAMQILCAGEDNSLSIATVSLIKTYILVFRSYGNQLCFNRPAPLKNQNTVFKIRNTYNQILIMLV